MTVPSAIRTGCVARSFRDEPFLHSEEFLAGFRNGVSGPAQLHRWRLVPAFPDSEPAAGE